MSAGHTPQNNDAAASRSDADWGPRPPRSRLALAVRFLLTVLHFPLHVLTFLVVFVVVYVLEGLGELLPFLENGIDTFVDSMLGKLPRRPRWWVSWPELRHEGDRAYFRERVEKTLRKRTEWDEKALAMQRNPRRRGFRDPTTSYEVHVYRAIGARALLDMAEGHGWELNDSASNDPAREIHLRRPAPAVPDGDLRIQANGV